MTNVPRNTHDYYKDKLLLTFLQSLIFILIVADITFDFIEGLPMKDLIFDLALEGTLLLLVLITTNFIWKRFSMEKEHIKTVETDLIETRELASHWERKSQDVAKEFQAFVNTQFIKWGLSKSEREIAFLMLSGKSSKEMSAHRFTSERTIRNQCQSIYEKSNLSGKNELSAFFLNELVGDFK